jgi:hypothetical protein
MKLAYFPILVGIISILLISGCTQTQAPAGKMTEKSSETYHKPLSPFPSLANNMNPEKVTNIELTQILLKQEELNENWLKKNSWGEYEFKLENEGMITYAKEGASNSIGGYWLPAHNAGYRIIMTVEKYQSIEDAGKAFAYEYDRTKSIPTAEKVDVSEVGNERFAAKGTSDLHSYPTFKIVFRRNNILVNLQATILSGDFEGIARETEKYAILMDNKIG